MEPAVETKAEPPPPPPPPPPQAARVNRLSGDRLSATFFLDINSAPATVKPILKEQKSCHAMWCSVSKSINFHFFLLPVVICYPFIKHPLIV